MGLDHRMDPLHLFIALGPLAAYLLLVGIFNLRKRPFVTTGARDAAALGVGLGGFAIAGPMELFLPEAANRWFPGGVWILLILMYVLCLSLLVLLLRPRLVIYNGRPDDLRPLFANLFAEIDADARWAGDCITLPSLKIQLSIESQPMTQTIQLVSAGPNQDPVAWKHLERAIQKKLRKQESPRSLMGYSLITTSLVLTLATTCWVAIRHQDIAASLVDMLRL